MKQENPQPSTDEDRGVVRLSREFDFPRATVFDMFTDPKKAVRWFGSPKGAVKVRFEMDARTGGALRLSDRWADGPVNHTTGTFLEVVAPERIAMRTATLPDGASAPWEALQTVTFDELGPTRTRVTVVVKVLATGAFTEGVAALAEGYQGGWGETLDMLRDELG